MSTLRSFTMPERQWSLENLIQLVEEYKKLPELWNRDHDLYRVQSAKYEAWASLAEQFSCEIVDIRKKLNSILASRRREKAKVREGGRSSWFLYPYLNFLSGHIDQPEIEVSLVKSAVAAEEHPESSGNESGDNDEADDTTYYHEVNVKKEPHTGGGTRRSSTPPASAPRHSKPKRRKVQVARSPSPEEQSAVDTQSLNLDLKMSEIIKILRKDHTKKKDECDSFGEYIASSLRNHDDKTRSMIKQAINNILFEQEMKKYSNGSYSMILSSDPVNNPLADSAPMMVHLVDEDHGPASANTVIK